MAGLREDRVIYGPVLSRRLGRSLGVNLLGTEQKLCNFNCIYCECGRTQAQIDLAVPHLYPPLDAVLSDLEKALRKPHSLDHITFSGNGESTLHPQFLKIIQETRKLRDRYKPGVAIAVFSNGSRAQEVDVLEALTLVDKPIMKLDVGDEADFARVNEPRPGICLGEILNAYKQIKGCIIQTMLFAGEKGNSDERSLQVWMEKVREIKPAEVQVYSLERAAPCPGVVKLSEGGLRRLSLLSSGKDHFEIKVY